MLLSLFVFFLFQSPFTEEKPQEEKRSHTFVEIPFYWFIALHQNYLTKIDGPRSHFYPCSSSYMKQAIKKHGTFFGVLKGMDRLLRENSDPWIYKTIKIEDDKFIKLDLPD